MHLPDLPPDRKFPALPRDEHVDAEALPVRLEYLKWNPVGTLYRRYGFTVIGETDIHWLMERPAAAAASRQ